MLRAHLWTVALTVSATMAQAQQGSPTPTPAATPVPAPSSAAASVPSPALTPVTSGPAITLACPTPAPGAAGAKCEWVDVLAAGAWPLVAFLALAALVWSSNVRRIIARLLRRVSKVKGGVVELEFSAEAARDVKASIHLDLRDYEAAARSEYDRQARAYDLAQRLRTALDAIKKNVTSIGTQDIRATVHVPDVIFAGHLYQLLDYQPKKEGRGRRWSERYGILGRAWRLRKSVYANSVLGPGSTASMAKSDIEHALIQSWGMNRGEAEQATSSEARQSFLCLILKVNTRQVGVLYFDAKATDVFKAAAANVSGQADDADPFGVRPDLESLAEVQELAAGVDKAMEELRKGAANLDFETKEQRG